MMASYSVVLAKATQALTTRFVASRDREVGSRRPSCTISATLGARLRPGRPTPMWLAALPAREDCSFAFPTVQVVGIEWSHRQIFSVSPKY